MGVVNGYVNHIAFIQNFHQGVVFYKHQEKELCGIIFIYFLHNVKRESGSVEMLFHVPYECSSLDGVECLYHTSKSCASGMLVHENDQER